MEKSDIVKRADMEDIVLRIGRKIVKKFFNYMIEHINPVMGMISETAFDEIDKSVGDFIKKSRFYAEFRKEMKQLYPDRHEWILCEVEYLSESFDIEDLLLKNGFDSLKAGNIILKNADIVHTDDADMAGLKIGLMYAVRQIAEELCAPENDCMRRLVIKTVFKNHNEIENLDSKVNEWEASFGEMLRSYGERMDSLEMRANGYESRIENIEQDVQKAVKVYEKLEAPLQNSEKAEYLKKYYEQKRHEFEDVPTEPTVVGNLSIEQAYIDIEVDKNPGVHRVSEYIINWCKRYDCGAHLLYGQPGHGKTTLGLKLVHDYIVGNVDFKVFCFPLVSPYYSMIDGDILRIYDGLLLDKYNHESRLDDALIKDSLIILDGYDELQSNLPQDNPYSDPVYFFDKIDQFAKEKMAYILITTRSITYESLTKEKRRQIYGIGDVIPMKRMSEEDQYAWIKEHNPDYLSGFQRLRETYLNVQESDPPYTLKDDIFGIPFIFLMTVAAEFDDEADNLVQLYDKLFESTLLRRNPVISTKEIEKERGKYENIALEMLPNSGKYTIRSGTDEKDYSMYTYSYYMKVVHKEAAENSQNGIDRYMEFYHRTFYEYFLAYYLYTRFSNSTEKDVDDFLYCLGLGNLDVYIFKYIKQIMKNRKGCAYNGVIQKRIEETDALIVKNDKNPLQRCSRIFSNALSLMNIFADGLSFHQDIQRDYSSYKDTKLCELLRRYKCTSVDLTGCKMIGAHVNRTDLKKINFTGADMTGKSDMSISVMGTCDFSHAKMNEIDMYRTFLDSSKFDLTDMSNGRFEYASLKKAQFTGTTMKGCNFIRADLSGARLIDVVIDKETNFTGAKLDGLITNVDLSCSIPEFYDLIEKGIIVYMAEPI